MKIDFSAGKEKYKKNERLINLIAAFSLVFQFFAVLATGLTAEKKSKATKVIMIISAIGGAVGSFFLYKELLAPAISKKLADYTLGDKDDSFDFDDEFNSYADSVGEPDLNWYEDEEEEETAKESE
ncbi:MAG: hypothetical protein IKH51_07805 [Clostridia bacterium]|jgi:hypothetical protein|nr:hypothetical protein [Clostridia bacterium]